MPEQPKDQLTDHEYDGIREYDNPTPGWWWWIFACTVIFAPLYFFIVLAARGVLSPDGQYERTKTAYQERLFAQIGELEPDARTILHYASDEEWLSVARNIFAARCVQCHGQEAGGMSGPNLTDENYLNVVQIEDIYDVIANGRNNNAMPAWKTQLTQNQMVLLSSYVAALRGTFVAGGKPAEGDAIEPWPETEPLPAAPGGGG